MLTRGLHHELSLAHVVTAWLLHIDVFAGAQARIVAGACQWFGSAKDSASTFLSSRILRKSVAACGALPD
jgi:hypothetical protein